MLSLLSFLSLLAIASSSSTNEQPRTFIVQVQRDSKPFVFPTHQQWYTSSLSSISPGTAPLLLHTYETVFHGFSAKLSLSEALKLQTLPHIIAVIPERVRHVHTTRSPQFLGLKTTDRAGLLKESDFGSDLVIGVIDTGICPESIYGGPGLAPGKMYPVVHAGSSEGGDGYSSSLCLEGSLDPKLVGGKIVLCDRGINSRAVKGEVVKKAGGVGMILANGVFDGEGLVADCHVLPATAVGASGGDEIRRYMSAASKSKSPPPTATIIFRGTRVNVRPAPVVASFSARGPNPQSPEILKPDVIAPGLNILAAWPDKVGPSGIPSDQRKIEFNILSGTSMACPHVSGLAALLKAAHPEWSSAAIRSALMTTAYTVDNRGEQMIDESTGNVSTVFDFGAGHVHPQEAMNPGLIYDISSLDYMDFLCNSNYTLTNIQVITRRNADCSGAKRAGHAGNLNYPSLTVVFQQYGKNHMSTHFIRTVTNVGDANSVYKVTIRPPGGTVVTVQPEKLVFRRVGQKLNFLVRVETTAVKLAPGASSMKSGSIIWADGKHTVASPVVVTMQQPL
ncbi:hypothetical protein OIU78_010325 [Salix suchowensis]|nr:hypothetical protein OIU78_010325 [Salix suchowensis]